MSDTELPPEPVDIPENEDVDADCGETPGDLLDLYVDLEEAGVVTPGDDVPVSQQAAAAGLGGEA